MAMASSGSESESDIMVERKGTPMSESKVPAKAKKLSANSVVEKRSSQHEDGTRQEF